MRLHTPCKPVTTHATLKGKFTLHTRLLNDFIGNSQIGQCTTLDRNGYNVKTLIKNVSDVCVTISV